MPHNIAKTLKDRYSQEKGFFLRSLARTFVFLLLLFALSAYAGFAASHKDPEAARNFFELIRQNLEQKGFFNATGNLELFALIFFNNTFASVVTVAAGIIPFIFLSAVSILGNGFMLGVVWAVSSFEGKRAADMILAILPHGIVELPALFYAGSLGIYLTLTVSKKLLGRDVSVKRGFADIARSFVLVVVPLLLLAAFLEAFVTYVIVKR